MKKLLFLLLFISGIAYSQVYEKTTAVGLDSSVTKPSAIAKYGWVYRGTDNHLYWRTLNGTVRLDTSYTISDSVRASWKADTLWGDLVAEQINYLPSVPTLTTVKKGLDSILNPYRPPTTTLSNNKGNQEQGTVITSTILTWTATAGREPITSKSINQGVGAVTSSPTTHTDTYSTNRTYTISVSDGYTTATANSSVTFLWKNYYGVSSADSIDDATIISSLSGTLASSKTGFSTSYSPSNQYIYIVYPSSYGTSTFTVNGLPNTDWKTWTRTVVNASGGSNTYRFYRHTTTGKLTGTYTIVVN